MTSTAETTSRPATRRRTSVRAQADARFGLLLATPALILVLGLVAWPGLRTAVYSLQRVSLAGEESWTGLNNFRTLFTDERFIHSLTTTVLYAVGFLLVSTLLGLGFALLLNEKFHGQWLARSLLIVPWACPWVMVGMIWKWFVDGEVGALNAALYQFGLIDSYAAPLSDSTGALVVAVLAGAWRQASFTGLLILAGLQTIPKELPQAAMVDGANVWQRFRHLTLPWLRPVIVVVVIINTIFGFMQFDTIWALTQGGPGDATSVLSIYLYEQLFVYTNIGLGSATAVVLGGIALVLGFVFVKLLYRSNAITEGVE
ncbi:ABC transporter permease [Micromonospora sonchi]|uniref:ABC transporter permease n=1 Tax=Micromonospora sonchi TaxID=1763543 RepID=A0A917U2E5_9ACTN|nr:sugar ABC transporter permease [Micromonospora sonchi]GGM53342.1 ABC transporter permease [Micromonospora sonchi]